MACVIDWYKKSRSMTSDGINIQTMFDLAKDVANRSNYKGGSPVGCVIVPENSDISIYGWNKYPDFVKEREENYLNKFSRRTRAPYVIHAEVVGILKAAKMGVDLHGASVFLTRYPCITCCSIMAERGIRIVRFLDRKDFEPEFDDYKLFFGDVEFIEYDESDYSVKKIWNNHDVPREVFP